MARDISHLAGDLTRRAQKIERAIDTGTRDIVRQAAQEAKDAQLEALRRDAGGDLRLSRVGRRGAAIGARYDLRGQGRTTSAEVKATGPVPLLANPSKPHRIPRQGGRRRRGVIVIPGVGVRAYANHPGTRGKDSWNKGRERAEPRVRTVIGRKTDEVVKRAFLSGG
jgi:hypothetical protein